MFSQTLQQQRGFGQNFRFPEAAGGAPGGAGKMRRLLLLKLCNKTFFSPIFYEYLKL